jgi:hypothetical protein
MSLLFPSFFFFMGLSILSKKSHVFKCSATKKNCVVGFRIRTIRKTLSFANPFADSQKVGCNPRIRKCLFRFVLKPG